MPRTQTFEDSKLNQEFDNLYKQIPEFIVSINPPDKTRTGLIWFNPSDGKLKIWQQTSWSSIN